jgi:hypothetical protein
MKTSEKQNKKNKTKNRFWCRRGGACAVLLVILRCVKNESKTATMAMHVIEPWTQYVAAAIRRIVFDLGHGADFGHTADSRRYQPLSADDMAQHRHLIGEERTFRRAGGAVGGAPTIEFVFWRNDIRWRFFMNARGALSSLVDVDRAGNSGLCVYTYDLTMSLPVENTVDALIQTTAALSLRFVFVCVLFNCITIF